MKGKWEEIGRMVGGLSGTYQHLGPCGLRILLRCLQPLLLGSPDSSPTTSPQIHLLYRGPWSILNTNLVFTHLLYQWFTRCQLEGKPQFFSMAFHDPTLNLFLTTALCSLTFQRYLTNCIFLHLFQSASLCAFVNAFLSSGMPFPYISLDSHYSRYKLLGYHRYQ